MTSLVTKLREMEVKRAELVEEQEARPFTWVPPKTGRSVSKIDVHDNLRSMMPGSDVTKATLLSVTATLAICLTVPAHGQVTVAQPELLSGPWEFGNGSRVDGILVMINRGTADGLTRETVQVRVYHRKDGRETWAWHVVSPPRDAAQFDGRQLVVAGLTATFDPDTLRWTGEWVLDGSDATWCFNGHVLPRVCR